MPNSYSRLFSRSISALRDRPECAQRTYPLREVRPTIVPQDLEPPDVDGSEQPAEAWWKRGNHRAIQMRSIIDYPLWNGAGWSGTLYTTMGQQRPPGVGLLFESPEAGEAIFSRWRERFGAVDEEEGIYLAFVRDVSAQHPAHYNILLTSRHAPEDVPKEGGQMVLSRFHRMLPDSSANLDRFLVEYERAGAFLLMPATLKDGQPHVRFDLAILKRKLSVKSAPSVSQSDIEWCCLGDRSQGDLEE